MAASHSTALSTQENFQSSDDKFEAMYNKALTGNVGAVVWFCNTLYRTRKNNLRARIVGKLFEIYENVRPRSASISFHIGTTIAHLSQSISTDLDNLATNSPQVFDDLLASEPPQAIAGVLNKLGKKAKEIVIHRNKMDIVEKLYLIADSNNPHAFLCFKEIYKQERHPLSVPLAFFYGAKFSLIDRELSTALNQASLSSPFEFDNLLKKQSPKKIDDILMMLNKVERETVIQRNVAYFKNLESLIPIAAGVHFPPGLVNLMIEYARENASPFLLPTIISAERTFSLLFYALNEYFNVYGILDFSEREGPHHDNLKRMIEDVTSKQKTQSNYSLSQMFRDCIATNRQQVMEKYTSITLFTSCPKESKFITLCDHILTKLACDDRPAPALKAMPLSLK